jgi:hypothetical protein
MRAPNRETASGYISSLFAYTNKGEPREWEEIDIELEGGRPDKFQANLIYGKGLWDWSPTRQWRAWVDKIETTPADEWRVFENKEVNQIDRPHQARSMSWLAGTAQRLKRVFNIDITECEKCQRTNVKVIACIMDRLPASILLFKRYCYA